MPWLHGKNKFLRPPLFSSPGVFIINTYLKPESYIQFLLNKTSWTEEELNWLRLYLQKNDAGAWQKALLEKFREEQARVDKNIPAEAPRILENIHRHILADRHISKKVFRLWPRVASVAAVLILCLGTYWVFFQHKDTGNIAPGTTAMLDDIAPGKNQAVLTLSNGKQVALDDHGDGLIPGQPGVALKKQNASLVYGKNKAFGNVTGNNLLFVPRGGQYKVVLSDGTKVWLNAESYLEYPVAFNGDSRQITLKGEAFLEVAQDANKPFLVNVDGMQVEVLGTSFNLKAYKDDARYVTTLVSGAVRVKRNGNAVRLQPGEQAVYRPGKNIAKEDADIDLATAWKNGLLAFKNENLPGVMQTICRWYNVQVKYDESIDPNSIHISGAMRRQEQLDKVLEILKLSAGIEFHVSGRTIYVSRPNNS